MNARILISVFILCTAIMANGIKALAIPYSPPPDWMPMTMLSITFDPAGNKLAITPPTFAAPLATNTNMVGMPAPGIASFDPAQPYAVLNGTAFSRRFGWWDPSEMSSTPLLSTVRAFYGPEANIWIQSLTRSPGLATYQAVGADGMQMGNSYPGIFGTATSPTKWLWDGLMDHNTYAVPFSAITKPNQYFSAYYKIYVGNAAGQELLVNAAGAPVASAATTTTWGWQAPPFAFTSQTGVAAGTTVESDPYTHTDASAPLAITGGEYALSTDGGLTWGPWSSAPGTINTTEKVKVRQTASPDAGTTTTAILSIPTANGPGTFSVTTFGPVTTPAAFSFTSQTNAATSTLIESSSIAVSGINAPADITISANGEYSASIDNGTTWSDWSKTVPATVVNGTRVKVRLTSSATPGTTTSATLTIGGVSASFVVTTGNPVTPQLFFTPVSGAPANTSVSGMPFYVTSNAIAASADASVSVSGGITPQYQVSADNGVSWTPWSNTTPATVASGNLVRVRVVPATTPFTTTVTKLTMGDTVAGFSVSTGYQNPPSWMPMAMLNVSFAPETNKLSVQDLHAHPSFPGTTLPNLTYVPAGSYDPATPWGILSSGVAISRQLGWDDSTALHGNGITVPGNILNQVRAAYGPSAGIWIECTDRSPGLESYFADGMFGVGGTGNGASGTPLVYSNPLTGLPIIYENNYDGIFGTAGSPTRWQWDGTMIHNVYAVATPYLVEPNQLFSATYRVYVGDSAGNDIAPEAATTVVWSWKGPATVPDASPDPFSFSGKTAVLLGSSVESEPVTVAGLTVTAPVAVTGGEYAVSADGGATWSAYSTSQPPVVANGNLVKIRLAAAASPAATTVATLAIGGVTGSFSVTTIDAIVTMKSNPLHSGWKARKGSVRFLVAGQATTEELAATVSASAPWITTGTLTCAKGRGRLTFTVAENASSMARNGSISIAGQTFAMDQTGKPLKLSVSPATTRLAAAGGQVDVVVAMEPDDGSWSVSAVKWHPEADQGWLGGFVVNQVQTGTATLSLTAAANGSGTRRSATLTVLSSNGTKRKTVKVLQAQ
jgi:hypothetical protein